MPRQARLDAPGTLHHVVFRGLERRAIVKDDMDREAFVTLLGAMAQATGTTIYGWALLPNHAHVLLRSGPAGLPRFMRRLLTGYAITFNRRHRRVGHLFQNRRALDRYPWGGHATVVGRLHHSWQDRRTVLGWFGRTEGMAVRAYRAYVWEGIPAGHRPDLVGGGLVRSAGGGPKCERAGGRRNRWRGTRVSWAATSSQGSCGTPTHARPPCCGERQRPRKLRR